VKAKLLASLALPVLLVGLAIPVSGSEDEFTLGEDLLLTVADFNSGQHDGLEVTAEGLTLTPASLTGRYISPIIEAPLAYNAVVPQWVAELPQASSLAIQLRTRTEAGHWSDWYDIERNDDWMLPEDSDVVGQMITVPAVDVTHQKIQYSVTFSRYAGMPAPLLRQLRLTFIDSTRGPTAEELVARQEALDALQPGAPESGYPKPTIVSRQVWCTDPACNYSGGLAYRSVTHLIVHHTVTSNSTSDWAATVRAIWRFHTFDRGWGDIGYNMLGDRNGVLYEGHLGGDDVIGTHASGANAGSMALALIGTFTQPYENPPGIAPPQAMLNSAAELFAWKADQKNIDVFDAGYLPNVSWGLPKLMGHRDVYGSTQCPGDQAHALLPWLRGEVANRIGFVSPHIYVDELSGAFVKSSSGFWETPPYGCGFNRHAFYTWSVTNAGSSTNWGEWRPNLAADGAYEVEVYAPYCITGRSETGGARYTITHAGGTDSVVVSHEANVGTWMSLGVFNFAAGNSGVIRLTDLTSTDSGLGVWFDAIRLRPIDQPPDPVVTTQQPLANTWSLQREVTFDWQVTNPSSVGSTRLEVATDTSFSNIVLSATFDGAPTSHTHTFGQDFGQLYWRIVLTTVKNKTIASTVTKFGIDTEAPNSEVSAVFRLEDGKYVVIWQGTDSASGVAGYNIDYRPLSGGAWTGWLSNTPYSLYAFVPPTGQEYEFRSQAIDVAGHSEPLHANGDANTQQAEQLFSNMVLPLILR
jgi:hypothetical protein